MVGGYDDIDNKILPFDKNNTGYNCAKKKNQNCIINLAVHLEFIWQKISSPLIFTKKKKREKKQSKLCLAYPPALDYYEIKMINIYSFSLSSSLSIHSSLFSFQGVGEGFSGEKARKEKKRKTSKPETDRSNFWYLFYIIYLQTYLLTNWLAKELYKWLCEK